MQEKLKMSSKTPEQFSLPVNDHAITMVKYLPQVSYYDLSTKLSESESSIIPAPSDEVRGVIFFAPAMAVPQLFYKYYLDYLSTLGYLVASLDFVGMGLSDNGPHKGSTITMHDWVDDLEVATQWFLDNYEAILVDLGMAAADIEQLPRYYVCHSLGGQLFGFLSNQNQFSKFVAVTSQNGYWKLYKNKYRYFFFWHFAVSPLILLTGHFPKWGGLGESLPPKVMKTWKKWCTSRNYFFDDANYHPQYEQYQHQILTIGFDDDPWATQMAIEDLYQHYINANLQHWHLDPADFELAAVGHFGYFKPASIRIWQKTLGWLD